MLQYARENKGGNMGNPITSNSREPKKLTEITCCVCGAKRMRLTSLVRAYAARGITEHTCGSKTCVTVLRSIKIREAKNTPEALSKISATSKAAWINNHTAHANACRKGLRISDIATSGARIAKMKATKSKNISTNPQVYSDAVRIGWQSRPHQVITPVDFTCAHCGKHVCRSLKPTHYARFKNGKLHFCSNQCNGEYKHSHVALTTRPCTQCGKPIVRRKAFVEYQERKGKVRFFCCNMHQRLYQDLHAKTHDTAPELVVKGFLQAQGVAINQHNVIIFHHPVTHQRWTIPDFTVGKVLVYVDGCVIHGCDVCGTKGFKNNKIKDPLITAELQKMGYIVFRLLEHELTDPASDWKRRLAGAIK